VTLHNILLRGSAAVALGLATVPAQALVVDQTNLVSDQPGVAEVTDPNLVNPWGISFSATSPYWISDNGTGLSTLYRGSAPIVQSLVVTIPPPAGQSGPAAPTGTVFNSTSGFVLSDGAKANFLFGTEDGTISGWNGGLGTNAALEVNNAGSGAVYKGLTLAGGNLYATNFNSGKVEVYDQSFRLVNSFTDPTVPKGYAPFNVQVLNGKLYVTFALQNAAKHDDVAGLGHGYVDVFDLSGNLLQRLVSNGNLDSPWGLDIAPSSYGSFGGDLLVGNFGNGKVNVYDPTTGAFIGELDNSSGTPLIIDGLWALADGNNGVGSDPNAVYFTAGPDGESHGLFGDLTNVPEPATALLLAMGLGGIAVIRRRAAAGR
jgi:uncharacterized protein (TIGR03118 family)